MKAIIIFTGKWNFHCTKWAYFSDLKTAQTLAGKTIGPNL